MNLSKRERQFMDIIFRLGSATAKDIEKYIEKPPSNSTIRMLLRILEEKGYLNHKRISHSYVYTPTISLEEASRSAMEHVLNTFYNDSAPNAVAALLDVSKGKLGKEDITEITELIKKAETDGR